MPVATDKQKAYALIGYFLKKYKGLYGAAPPGFNRHSLSWGFEGLLADYPDRGEEIVDYFFEVYKEHNPTRLVYDYGKIVEDIEQEAEDKRQRAKLRRKTKERMQSVIDRRQSNQGGSE